MGHKYEDDLARKKLGAAIRQLRTEKRLSRRELESATGLSYPYLSEIEAGKKSPSTRTLRVIADALGLEAHELLQTAEGEPGMPSSAPPPARSPFHDPSAAFAMLSYESPRTVATDSAHDELVGRLAQLVNDLSSEDIEILIQLAARLHNPPSH